MKHDIVGLTSFNKMKIKINSNSCRVCLENVGEIPFFQDHGEEIIAEIISSLFNIDVIYDVNLPTTICTNCLENIKLCVLTRNIIVNSESMLNTYLKHNIIGESVENLNQIKVEKEEPIVTQELVELKADEIKIERPEPEDSSKDFEDEQCAAFQIIKVQSLASFNPDPQSEPTVSPKTYDCEICDFKADTHKRLIFHKKIHTATLHDPARSRQKQTLCKFCGKIVFRSNMAQHFHITHSGERPFSCSFCDKTFSRFDNLYIHMKIHFKSMDLERKQSNRKHKCDECNKSFRTRTSLNRHKVVHSDVKEHVCLYCGKKFALNAYLKRHVQLVHETDDPRNIICQICGKVSTSSYRAKSHFLMHTGDKPFQCKFCDSKFVYSTSLREHINKKHVEAKDGRKKV